MMPETGLMQTKVRLLTDNMESWYSRWYVIDRAQESIDMTYYILDGDIFGKSLLGLLYKKAREGVKIRLMVDARGSRNLGKKFFGPLYLQELAKFPNVQVRIFNPINRALKALPENVRNVMCSNHDKIVIGDNEWALTGGRNISRNYFADPRDMPSSYRDTDVLLQG